MRIVSILFLLSLCALGGAANAQAPSSKIQHVIIIMQENRSFDSYFGTFPAADGIPSNTCVPRDPSKSLTDCIKPFHDQNDVNAGGPHTAQAAQADMDDGIRTAKMDGFVKSQAIPAAGSPCLSEPTKPGCVGSFAGALRHDAVGYHTDADIPNYWAYARNFVLQDHMFEGERSWSLPSHLDLISEWSASCSEPTNAMSCKSDLDLFPDRFVGASLQPSTTLPWANLFQFLDKYNVTWKYYLGEGDEPDCDDGEMTCDPQVQTTTVPSIWNPAPYFASVKQQGAAYLAAHVVDTDQFLVDVKKGTLPAVSWIAPADTFSEHPPSGVTAGMEYVTSLVNAVMSTFKTTTGHDYWSDTAIFIAWDDWGGFYDHVPPPIVDHLPDGVTPMGFGLRVPGLLVSAWAKPGLVDHNIYSFESYARLVEDLFLNSRRLNPVTLGVPDNRPTIRDKVTSGKSVNGETEQIGDLLSEFDFSQSPLPPLVLSTYIPTGIAAACDADLEKNKCQWPVVTVSWAPVTGPDVPGPFTYEVKRDGLELPACTGAKTFCEDSPGTSGAHFYRVRSLSYTGAISPWSAAAEADVP